MNWMCLVMIAAWGVPIATSLAAQVPRGRTARSNAAPRLMVANPFAFSTNQADSATSVQIGSATRQGIQELLGDDYNVVTREQMNEALELYGYPHDAILNTSLAVTLAKNIQARIVVTGTLVKEEDGRHTVTARLIGVNDDAGNVTTATRRSDERMADFGYRLAEALTPAVKSLKDAKACIEEREAKPDKAVKSAEKAIKKVPNHGLAQFCLYEIAKQQKAPREEAVKHLEAAVKGDPFSVPAWTRLAAEYNEAKDTANALLAAKQLLRIAPTDQQLRERVFRYLLRSGQPKLALEVAEEGLKIDPYNPELYDLKANACLFLTDFACALGALEKMYAIDSTKADTLFFTKMTAAAVEAADTARLLQWAQIGSRKYPGNLELLNYLNQAYVMTKQLDSSSAVTHRILTKDTTAVRPALANVQALAQANRLTDAAPYIDFVKRYGDQAAKEQLAGILVPVAYSRLQGDSAAGKPRDLAGAVELGRLVAEVAAPNGQSVRYGNFVLGVALLQQAAELDTQTEQQKSCDMARQEQQLLAESKDALGKVQSMNGQLKTEEYLKAIEVYGPRVDAMLKAYC